MISHSIILHLLLNILTMKRKIGLFQRKIQNFYQIEIIICDQIYKIYFEIYMYKYIRISYNKRAPRCWLIMFPIKKSRFTEIDIGEFIMTLIFYKFRKIKKIRSLVFESLELFKSNKIFKNEFSHKFNKFIWNILNYMDISSMRRKRNNCSSIISRIIFKSLY